MDIAALQLCSHFAFKPNSLGYCGNENAQRIMYDCITNRQCKNVATEIRKFRVLNPYIQTIAQVTGYDPFSYEVIEAYWLGNSLLRKIKPNHYQLLIENLRKQGVPQVLLHEVGGKIPKRFIPIHLFNILYIGVGRATMSVPFNLNSINSCMIRTGKVHKVYSNKIKVELTGINKDYELDHKIVVQHYNPLLAGKIKDNDVVLAHWGSIVKKATMREMKLNHYWTEQLLQSLT